MSDQIIRLLQSSICFGTVIMYGAMGEILTEKSGNLNLGVPGIQVHGAGHHVPGRHLGSGGVVLL